VLKLEGQTRLQDAFWLAQLAMQAAELSARCGLFIRVELWSASVRLATVVNRATALPKLNPIFIDDLRAD
jgi:hypothetical protein